MQKPRLKTDFQWRLQYFAILFYLTFRCGSAATASSGLNDSCVHFVFGNGTCQPYGNCEILKSFNISPRFAGTLTKSCEHTRFPTVCCPLPSVVIEGNRDLFPRPPTCGYVLSDRIIGGTVASYDEFPWSALLGYKSANGKIEYNCGGSLINKQWVITAAHCITKDLSFVRLGEWNITSPEDCIQHDENNTECLPHPIDVPVNQTFSNPNFFWKAVNDIALVRLQFPIKYSLFVKPICLPLDPSLHVMRMEYGSMVEVTGWGYFNKDNINSDVKRKARLSVVPVTDCNLRSLAHFRTNSFEYSLICALGKEGQDSCKGDSGGPLMVESTGRDSYFYLAGIVSMGFEYCVSGYAGLYTKVTPFLGWIKETMQNNSQ